jgi:hypothetical protein
MESVLLLTAWERYEGEETLGIFTDDEQGKALAEKTANDYYEKNRDHLQYAWAGRTLQRVKLNRPDLLGRTIKEW